MGSRKKQVMTWSSSIRNLQKELRLTERQRKLVVGTLLGDGCLIPNATGRNYRLQVEHGAKQQDYVNWKYGALERWCLSPPKHQRRTKSVKFRTISHPQLSELYAYFYRNRKKVLPVDIEQWLGDPFVVAVWFMDDGGVLKGCDGSGRAMLLNVQQFGKDDVGRIQQTLRQSFGFETTRQWNNSGYRLYLPRVYCESFNHLIGTHFIPSMRYKLVSS